MFLVPVTVFPQDLQIALYLLCNMIITDVNHSMQTDAIVHETP